MQFEQALYDFLKGTAAFVLALAIISFALSKSTKNSNEENEP